MSAIQALVEERELQVVQRVDGDSGFGVNQKKQKVKKKRACTNEIGIELMEIASHDQTLIYAVT